MIVLGIETSCDETSLSIINEDNSMLSNVIVSQHSTHSPHGGIIPPWGECVECWETIILESIVLSSLIILNEVSSQEVSIPNTIIINYYNKLCYCIISISK